MRLIRDLFLVLRKRLGKSLNMDPIADMLTRIRNAQAVQKETVVLPYSSLKYEVAEIMKKKGFIKDVKSFGKGAIKKIKIDLRYSVKGQSAINGLKKISRPGQRIYKSAGELRPVKGGSGISIVTTSKGLMTGYEAKKSNVGGEIICEIW